MRQSCGRKCLVDARGQRRMARLIQDDRRATLTEVTTRQQSICEATTHTTLRRMGYNSRRPHRVPLISTTRLKFARAKKKKNKKNIGQLKTGKMLPGLMSLDFC